ncbi:MAG: efflux RND transporter periplasmic adaptor subunit, partial [Cyclobacteriaceae bacterium]
VKLTGKIQINEKKLTSVTSDFPGRVEKLHVNFTGQEVNSGDILATVYSPDLVTAQQELLQAVKMKGSFPALYQSAREKLRLWKLNDRQIDDIESRGETVTEFDILAGVNGIVTKRNITKGDYVSAGMAMFEIADLSTVWVVLDAYESDLAWIGNGGQISFTVPALPGEEFNADITFIDPVIDSRQRTADVRAEISNSGGRFKPEMFVNGTVKSVIREGISSVAVPRTAILWSGRRSLVYVKLDNTEYPAFEMREVIIGPRLGEMYLVEQGLDAGEEIVTNGVFAVDAAAQLSGNYSMMTPPPVKTMDVPVAFQEQITRIADDYFSVKNSLVDSDSSVAASAAEDFLNTLSAVDMTLLDEESHHQWMTLLVGLNEAAGMIAGTETLDEQRVHFEHLSMNMIEVVEYFGLQLDMIYKMYCPMAFDNEGAYWLSTSEEILNPYFGEMMLRCGEIRETYRRGIRVFRTQDEPAAPMAGHQH